MNPQTWWIASSSVLAFSCAARAHTFSLDALPAGATLHGVTAQPAEAAGRKALRVELTEQVVRTGAEPGGRSAAGADIADHQWPRERLEVDGSGIRLETSPVFSKSGMSLGER